MSYNTQEMSEIRVSSKIDRTAFTETLSEIEQLCPAAKKPLLLPEVGSCHNSVKFFN